MNSLKQYQLPIAIFVIVVLAIVFGLEYAATKSELSEERQKATELSQKYTPFDLDNVRSQARELEEKNKLLETEKVNIELQVKELQTKRDKADEGQKVNATILDSLYNKSNGGGSIYRHSEFVRFL